MLVLVNMKSWNFSLGMPASCVNLIFLWEKFTNPRVVGSSLKHMIPLKWVIYSFHISC